MIAQATRATMTGTETILGHVTSTLTEHEEVTHVTITGTVIHETVRGLQMPVEGRLGESVELVMVPLKSRHPHLLTVELLEG